MHGSVSVGNVWENCVDLAWPQVGSGEAGDQGLTSRGLGTEDTLPMSSMKENPQKWASLGIFELP